MWPFMGLEPGLPPGKSSGSREVRLRIEMKRRRLRGSSGFFVLFHHRPHPPRNPVCQGHPEREET